MMLSLYVTLGVFLLLAIRNPLASRSLIAFSAWSSFAQAAVMGTQALRNMISRGELNVGYSRGHRRNLDRARTSEAAFGCRLTPWQLSTTLTTGRRAGEVARLSADRYSWITGYPDVSGLGNLFTGGVASGMRGGLSLPRRRVGGTWEVFK
jgi:hypothetical protein